MIRHLFVALAIGLCTTGCAPHRVESADSQPDEPAERGDPAGSGSAEPGSARLYEVAEPTSDCVVDDLANTLVTVETRSPDEACPDAESARQAVAERLGIELREGGWVCTHDVIRPAEEQPFVRLEVRAPEGRVTLSRRLPFSRDDCRFMAQAIARVLEMYFLCLGQTASEGTAADAHPPVH